MGGGLTVLRKSLFWIHLSAGAAAGIVVLIMCVTGVLLGFERQILAWADRGAYRSAPAPGRQRLDVEALLAKLPDAPSSITLRSDPTEPAEAGFGRERTVYLNPYTGSILGEGSKRAHDFFQQVTNWHRWLAAGTENRAAGRAITGASNLLFLLLILSGPFLWLPRKFSRQHLKPILVPRLSLAGKARDFNWHNALGIWSAGPLAIVVASSVVMSYGWANNLLYTLTGTQAPQSGGLRPAGPRGGRGEKRLPNYAGLDELWLRAEKQVPNYRSISLRLEGAPAFTIDSGSGGQPDRRATLTFNRRTGEVVSWEPFSKLNAGRRLRSYARFAHTGEAGGLAGQVAASAASASGAFLAYTGLALALRRLHAWRVRRAAKTPEAAAVAS
jgi:uncharacterized iron-regulated membrane protein